MAIERPIIERITAYTYNIEPSDGSEPYVSVTLGKGRYDDEVNMLTGEPRWLPEQGSDGKRDEKVITIPWSFRDHLKREAEGDVIRAAEAEEELKYSPEAHTNYPSWLAWQAAGPKAVEFVEAANAADDPMKKHIYLMLAVMRDKGMLP